jgi:hypothetical protein
VRLPLLIGSIPIARRDNVGVGEFSVHDCPGSDATRVRAYEFFAGSSPERARGLNRLGFLREATRLGRAGPEETAHFGVMTISREESVEEARRAVDKGDTAQLYAFISGVIGPRGASNTVVRAPMSGRWTSASDLFRQVRPLWEAGPVAYSRTVVNAGRQQFESPVGFLGAIELSLRQVASEVAAARRVRGNPVAYVHNGRVYRLVITGGGLDAGQRAVYEAEGVLAPAAEVWRVEYRIVNEQRREVETFRIWVELPPTHETGPFAPPIVPLGFEFRPRSFLELRAVRMKVPPS